eukprot:9474517-Pyramimonas_sp.AAC.1
MPPEALFFDSEQSHAWKELYEVPGGDQVDGSPPVPVRFENRYFSHLLAGTNCVPSHLDTRSRFSVHNSISESYRADTYRNRFGIIRR